MSQANLWAVAIEALRALNNQYLPAIETEEINQGIEPGGWGTLLAASSFEPDVITAARLRVRNPYTAPNVYEGRLAGLANAGLLDSNGFGEYWLSQRGKEAVAKILTAAYERMSGLQPLFLADLEKLAALLERLVKACLEAPEPPGKWCLGYSRKMDPGEKAHPVVRIDQYLSDLDAYRDDAHLAAWQIYGFTAPAWEALTLLWHDQGDRLDTLFDSLARRGYPIDTYVQALEELLQRGLLREEGEIYSLTQMGLDLRQRAEDATDHAFFAPWECLSKTEQARLRDLLTRFQHALSM